MVTGVQTCALPISPQTAQGSANGSLLLNMAVDGFPGDMFQLVGKVIVSLITRRRLSGFLGWPGDQADLILWYPIGKQILDGVSGNSGIF
jgi:hypothetical protein